MNFRHFFATCLLLGIVREMSCRRRTRMRTRIIGGRSTTIEEAPYMASIRKNNIHFCAGAIISKHYVLTAAHCFKKLQISLSRGTIMVGITMSNLPDGLTFNMEKIIQHEDYDEESGQNDLGLIKVEGEFTFSVKIQPIRFAPSGALVPVGAYCTVAGWGATEVRSMRPLKIAMLPIVEHEFCVDVYEELREVTDEMICTGYEAGGTDSCQGDSGGPLVYNNLVVGVVSFGLGCGREGVPGVYTQVSSYSEWIHDKIVN